MMKSKQHTQNGFTIIELLLATTIFSIVLVVILAAFLQIGRMFYKGVSVNNTNESTRSLVDSIANDVRFSQRSTGILPPGPGTKKYFCTGAHRYTFNLYSKVSASDAGTVTDPHSDSMQAGVVQDVVGNSCPSPTTRGVDAQQLLGPEMQLNNLTFSCDSQNNICTVHARVIFYGADNGVFDADSAAGNDPKDIPALALKAPDARCSGNLLSTQFCAMADLTANVALRY